MNRKSLSIIALSFLAILVGLSVTKAEASVCPAYGADTDCAVFITIGSGGSLSLTKNGQGPYDGNDDSYISVTNNSGKAINSFNLSSPNPIFGFDGDGIDSYGSAGNAKDGSGYGGPDVYFTNINLAQTAGTVDFVTPLGNGRSTYFSLELPPSAIMINTVPEPGSLALFGTGVLGLYALMRRRNNQL